MNIITFDVEEWFHLLDFDATRGEEQWKRYPVRIHENVERVMNILEATDTKATFFVIGWIAKQYPEVVRKIAEKYQVGCHTMTHQLVWQQTPEQFHDDVEAGVKLLEDITGKKCECFRAPGFSIRESEAWAFESLAELGIKYDCSVFPAHHAHGGMPTYPDSCPGVIEHRGVQIKEFPVSFKSIGGKHLIFNGGGYFRLFPYKMIKELTLRSDGYVMCYIHPRDLDAGQPVLEGLPLVRRFKSYVGLKGAAKKLQRYLTDFEFIDIATADKMVDWEKALRVRV